jgi:hypothetical protein
MRRVNGGRPQRTSFVTDPETGAVAELRRVQPFAARKLYLCPGCNQDIRVGVGHVVVVPLDDPGNRRHWHAPCFEQSGARRPGRR